MLVKRPGEQHSNSECCGKEKFLPTQGIKCISLKTMNSQFTD